MTAITEKATLGQAVTFDATLVRRRLGDRDDTREWRTVKGKQRVGILVGTRTLWNGTVHTEVFDAEDGGGYHSCFVQGDHFPALLVAYALNRKPVLVPLSHIIAA
jgi:hypothetical protein